MAGQRRGLPRRAGGAWPVARVTRGLCLSLQIPPDLSGCLGRPGQGRINGHSPLPSDLLPCPGRPRSHLLERNFLRAKDRIIVTGTVCECVCSCATCLTSIITLLSLIQTGQDGGY